MSSRKITIIKNHKVIRWIVVGLLSGSAVMLAFQSMSWLPASTKFWLSTGFNRLSVVPKLALATSEALPYGCAGFTFGEMWNATDGVGFMMTVAGATYQTDRGMTAFIVLMLLFATIHSALHRKDDVD